jgi:hypothetical protein
VRAPFAGVLILTLALVSLSLQAQGLPCSRQTVPVAVTDNDGRVVMGLTASNFRIQVHRRPATILSASNESSPRRIALLLDASESMLAPAVWKSTLNVANTLIEDLSAQDSIAFMAFAGQIERRIDFTHDPKSILPQLENLQPGTKVISKNMRGTHLWDSVLAALSLFDSPRAGDSIYVISDGFDTGSQAGPSDVENALLAGGVRFFAIMPAGVNLADISRTYESKTGRLIQPRKEFEEVSDTTGGALVTAYHEWINGTAGPLSQAELEGALSQVNTLTHQFYRLEIELPQPIDKSRDWQFEVVDQTHKGKLPLLLRYPRRLVPCGSKHVN